MIYWIWLSQIKGIGSVTQKKLLTHFGSPQKIFETSTEELIEVGGIGKTISQHIKSADLSKASVILEKVQKRGVNFLAYDDPLYFDFAKQALRAPILLYYRGILKPIIHSVGIVGSRRCTEYGKYVTAEAAGYLAKKGIPVISGMAKGIDGYAHTACMKADGYTLAFLGSGIDICYPREHKILMEQIIKNGVVLSEYPPGIEPKAGHFPKRNELIAAWSKKLLVVEASEKSGALLTAKYAKSLGREIYAVPNQIYNKTSKGTNQLIADGEHIYLLPQQLLINGTTDKVDKFDVVNHTARHQNVPTTTSLQDGREYTADELDILNILTENGSLTMEEIGIKTNIPELELLSTISTLELAGVLHVLPGGRYVLTA